MALINVNPTRMEMTRLKKRLATSIRGHKLLKDKRDDLMKKFLDLIRKNKELREQVEQEISDIYGGFVVASAVMSPQMLEEALMLPKQSIDLEVGERNVMSVTVPSFEFNASENSDSDIYSYGFVATSGELDDSVAAVKNVLPHLLELAQIEKSAQMIAEEVKAQLNLNVDKKKIQLKEAIKTLGTHNVSVKLHPQVTAELKVVVQEEA